VSVFISVFIFAFHRLTFGKHASSLELLNQSVKLRVKRMCVRREWLDFAIDAPQLVNRHLGGSPRWIPIRKPKYWHTAVADHKSGGGQGFDTATK
jgi:hypothetical protein